MCTPRTRPPPARVEVTPTRPKLSSSECTITRPASAPARPGRGFQPRPRPHASPRPGIQSLHTCLVPIGISRISLFRDLVPRIYPIGYLHIGRGRTADSYVPPGLYGQEAECCPSPPGRAADQSAPRRSRRRRVHPRVPVLVYLCTRTRARRGRIPDHHWDGGGRRDDRAPAGGPVRLAPSIAFGILAWPLPPRAPGCRPRSPDLCSACSPRSSSPPPRPCCAAGAGRRATSVAGGARSLPLWRQAGGIAQLRHGGQRPAPCPDGHRSGRRCRPAHRLLRRRRRIHHRPALMLVLGLTCPPRRDLAAGPRVNGAPAFAARLAARSASLAAARRLHRRRAGRGARQQPRRVPGRRVPAQHRPHRPAHRRGRLHAPSSLPGLM